MSDYLSLLTFMSKRKPRRTVMRDPAGEFSPRLTLEEKVVSHRKASARYYSKNPEIRERRRLQMREKRAAEKLKKNTPFRKEIQVPSLSLAAASALPVPEHHFMDPRAIDFGAASSKHFSEVAAMSEVSNDQGSPHEQANRSVDSVLEREKLLSSSNHSVDSVQEQAKVSSIKDFLGDSIAPVSGLARALANDEVQGVAPGLDLYNLPSGVTPLSRVQRVALAGGKRVLLTSVQSAQIQVAARNRGKLTPPTPEEAARWCEAPEIGQLTSPWFTYQAVRSTECWCCMVRTWMLKAACRKLLEREPYSDDEYISPMEI
ncbi:hypothetical protein C8R44DRAFT_989175 [Mycena epipterygia]|nr:hypothetical protein C8R44DRAFT_989175 [Mycena epipterygia]